MTTIKRISRKAIVNAINDNHDVLAAIADAMGADVADVSSALSSVYSDLPASLVFLTASRDTRFSQYGLLQPAIAETES